MSTRYGVIGYPVNHSLSPFIHKWFARQTRQDLSYAALTVQPGQFEKAIRLLQSQQFSGVNITIPFKEEAFVLATEHSLQAEQAKAVNTLVFKPNGDITGHNTDGMGLIRDVTQRLRINLTKSKILILGAGGAVRGILPALLEQSPAEIVLVNRTLARVQQLQTEFHPLGNIIVCEWKQPLPMAFDLIINAISSHQQEQPLHLPYQISKTGGCYDLNYGASAQAFLGWAQTQQPQWLSDGLGMLIEQAAAAFFIWHGIHPDTQPVLNYFSLKNLRA